MPRHPKTHAAPAERRARKLAQECAPTRAVRRTLRIGGVRLVADVAGEPSPLERPGGPHRGGDAVKGRQVAVLCGAGERRRDALADLGQRCACGFDALVVYESAHPGASCEAGAAALGSSARAILEGARQCEAAHPQRHCKLDVHHALRFALSLCRPGDIVVFACTSLEMLRDALHALTRLPARQPALR